MAKLSYGRNAKTGQYVSAGRASDGVVILRQAAKPKHFTLTEIEKTVDGLKGPSASHYDADASRGSRVARERGIVRGEPMPPTGRGRVSKKDK